MSKTKRFIPFFAITLGIVLLLLTGQDAQALVREKGLSGDYQILIDDEAGLLSDNEEKQLAEAMRPISRYGTVVFWTTEEGYGSTESKVREYLSANVSRDVNFSCTAFVIDMKSRQLWIQSRGQLLKFIGISSAYSITNNVSGKATRKDYYGCASAAYAQMYSRIQGTQVPSPMRIICSVLTALSIGLAAAYKLLHKSVRNSTSLYIMNFENTPAVVSVEVVSEKMVTQTKTRRSSDSGGGSSCGGSSCGGSSCSSCGGGGGSGF